MNLFKTISIILTVAFLLAGCKAADSESSILPDGSYTDNWGDTHVFTSTLWEQTYSYDGSIGTYAVVKANASGKYIIYQNDAGNDYNPSKFSRLDFAQDTNEDLYYCQIAYNKDSATEAEAMIDADANDLTSGCDGNPWTKLIPAS